MVTWWRYAVYGPDGCVCVCMWWGGPVSPGDEEDGAGGGGRPLGHRRSGGEDMRPGDTRARARWTRYLFDALARVYGYTRITAAATLPTRETGFFSPLPPPPPYGNEPSPRRRRPRGNRRRTSRRRRRRGIFFAAARSRDFQPTGRPSNFYCRRDARARRHVASITVSTGGEALRVLKTKIIVPLLPFDRWWFFSSKNIPEKYICKYSTVDVLNVSSPIGVFSGV